MKPIGIVGAIVGGIAGAIVWGMIAKFLSMELGYVAWGVGLAVGFCSYAMGGRGVSNGILCSIVALAAMFGGKTLAMKWTATADDMLNEMKGNALFEEMSETEKKQMADSVASQITWGDAASAATENLDIIDIVFAVLGVGTAFKLGAAPGEEKVSGMAASPLRDVAPPTPPPTDPPSG